VKLIFFGGCFDPPHKGHYEIIRKCAKHCHRLIIIPTLNSPLKNKISSTEPHHILQMLKLLIQDIDTTIEIDEYDFSRPGPSYTVDTIRYIQQKYPKSSISMVVGADQLMKFQQWKEYNEVINSVHIIGFNRANCDFTPLPKMNITWIEDFNMDISSVKIKKDISAGELKDNVLTPLVKNYIFKNNVYGNE
jgi:nicotinate-nucleotide adenylyltransferase